MATIALSSQLGTQLQQLEANQIAGVYDLADTFVAELDEFGMLSDGPFSVAPTVVQLSSTQVVLSYEGDNEDYVVTYAGSGIGPVSSLADLELAIDGGLATGALDSVDIDRVVGGIATTILSVATSASGYSLTSGVDVFTVTGSLPASFEDLFDLADLVGQLDMDTLASMTSAARTAYFNSLSAFGITGLSVGSNGDTFVSLNLTPTAMTVTIGHLELQLLGTVPDDFGLMARVAYDLFNQSNAGLPMDLSAISGLGVNSVTLRVAGGASLYTVTGPITDEFSTFIESFTVDGVEWSPEVVVGITPWEGYPGAAYLDSNGEVRFGSNNVDAPDEIEGSISADFILGLAGNDTIYGGHGADSILGGVGDDYLRGEAGNDTIDGGDGFDIVNSTSGIYSVDNRFNLNSTRAQSTGEGMDVLISIEGVNAGGGNDWVTGNAVDNWLFGNWGNDRLLGGKGADTVDGGDGNDTVQGDDGHDSVVGGWGDDSMRGGANNDTMQGADGNDRIYGDDGIDWIYGDAGEDRIEGGLGRDFLYGGLDADRDIFVFSTLSSSLTSSARDAIYEFALGIDDIVLSPIDANLALAGNQAFAFSGTSAAVNSVWYTAGSGFIVVYADGTGDGAADFSVRVNGITSISATDFVL